ncbi:hypothetical protein GGI12_006119, partial [Dipsacomyces acuminosporus]
MAYSNSSSAQPQSMYAAHTNGLSGNTLENATMSYGTTAHGTNNASSSNARERHYGDSGERRRRTSSTYAMNIDTPTHDYQHKPSLPPFGAQHQQQHQQQQQPV